tara:strand:- start:3106 stop:3735 length:630 start_codon:yes stop_codon:yes gene_type:complete
MRLLKIFSIGILTIAYFPVYTFATSLWKSESLHVSASHKPDIRPGDILTIIVDEAATAKNDFKQEVSDSTVVNSDMWAKLRNILSLSKLKYLDTVLGKLNESISNQNHTSEMEGEGKMTANSSLQAEVTVTVTSILPNGNIRIEGRKSVLINSETQRITITGTIRPEDVQNNMVASSKVANAEIKFTGKGAFDGLKKPGPLQRVMNIFF